jgi:ribonuclease HII
VSASAAEAALSQAALHVEIRKVAWKSGARLVASVDEVGRGSLFGPVVAAAVILDREYRVQARIRSCCRRAAEVLAERIRTCSGVGDCRVDAVDRPDQYLSSRRGWRCVKSV